MKKIYVLPIIVLVIAASAYLIWLKILHKKPSTPTNTTPTTQKTEPTTTTQPQQPSFDKTAKSINDPASIWVVVNKKRPLQPTNYAPEDLIAVGGGQYLRQEAATKFNELKTAAATAGLSVMPLSGYRSYATQVAVYNNEVATNGQTIADTQSARPGTSEHQTGLAIDVGGGGCGIEDCFGNTEEGKWLQQHAYEYGFIIRYIEGKQSVTGYRAEPWHIRYIGVELAKEMTTQNIPTLEEFFGLDPAPSY